MIGTHLEYRFSKLFRAMVLCFGLLGAGLVVFIAARALNDRRETATYVMLLIFVTLIAVYLLSIYRTTAGYIVLRDDALTQVLPDGSRVSIRWDEITEITRGDPVPGHTRILSTTAHKNIRIEHQLRDYVNLMDEIARRVPHLHEHIHTFHIFSAGIALGFLIGIPAIAWGLTGAGIPQGRFQRVDQFLLCAVGFLFVWKALGLIRSVTVGRNSLSIKTLLGGRTIRDISNVELRPATLNGRNLRQAVVVITTRSGGQTKIFNVKEGEEVLYAKLTALVDQSTPDSTSR
jgi:hypothetical protein